MPQIIWKVSEKDQDLAHEIAKRAVEWIAASDVEITYSLLHAEMDILATHANGNPLKLQELLDADEDNFLHDVFGIRRHLNRRTGELEDFFVPRFSQPE